MRSRSRRISPSSRVRSRTAVSSSRRVRARMLRASICSWISVQVPYQRMIGAVPVADRLRLAQYPAILAGTMAQTVFDLVMVAGIERTLPPGGGARLIVGMEDAVPRRPVGRSRGYAGIFIPPVVEIIVVAIGQRRPDHLIDRIDHRMQFRLAVAQLLALRLQLFQPFAGLILTGACLERRTHRAQQIVAVERSRQEHRIVERVDPVRFRPTPLRARLVGQHDEGAGRTTPVADRSRRSVCRSRDRTAPLPRSAPPPHRDRCAPVGDRARTRIRQRFPGAPGNPARPLHRRHAARI